MDDYEGILILAVCVALAMVFRVKKKKKPVVKKHEPIITVSENGYEGHLDFLEQHGYISKETRESQRNNNGRPH